MHDWIAIVESAGIGITSGALSARISVAILSTDMRWVKKELDRIWTRLRELENRR